MNRPLDALTPLLKKRLFIAVKVDSESCPRAVQTFKQLRRVADELGTDMRWLPLKNWHITVHFIGYAPESQVGIYGNLMTEVAQASAPFEITLEKVGAFPQVLAARVLWMGVSNTRPFKEIQMSLLGKVALLSENTADPEMSLDYQPHLTLGRTRSVVSIKKLIEPFKNRSFDSLRVTELVLFESQMQNYTPTYVPLLTVPLGTL